MKTKIRFILSVGLFIAALMLLSKKVQVTRLSCQSQFGPCSQEINTIVSDKTGAGLIDAKRELSEVLSESTRVEYFKIKFALPTKLDVYVVEKKAEVALEFPENYYLFDKEGNTVAVSGETALPTVFVEDVPSDSLVRYAARLFYNLNKYYEVSDARLNKFSLSAKIGDTEVIFPLEGDIDVHFGAMEVVLLQLNRSRENPTINSTGNLSMIDLRYKNPVIR